MTESTSLHPGTLLQYDNDFVVYRGVNQETHQPVVQVNPLNHTSRGALHTDMPFDILKNEARRVQPFCELYSFDQYQADKTAWQNLNPDVEVPFPPKSLEVMLRFLKDQGITSFKPHFKPDIELFEHDFNINGKSTPYPSNWKPFGESLLLASNIIMESDSLTTPEGWVLVDTTAQQAVFPMYPNDQLRPALKQVYSLHETNPGSISAQGIRSAITYPDIQNIILPTLQQLLIPQSLPDSDKGHVQLPSAVESYVLGNMFQPELLNQRGQEFLGDKITFDTEKNANRYFVLLSGNGQPNVEFQFLRGEISNNRIGFRPIITVPT